MFAQPGNTGDDYGETKDENQKLLRNLDNITYNECVEKGYCVVNNEFSTQTKLKHDAEAFKKSSKINLGTIPLMEKNKKH